MAILLEPNSSFRLSTNLVSVKQESVRAWYSNVVASGTRGAQFRSSLQLLTVVRQK